MMSQVDPAPLIAVSSSSGRRFRDSVSRPSRNVYYYGQSLFVRLSASFQKFASVHLFSASGENQQLSKSYGRFTHSKAHAFPTRSIPPPPPQLPPTPPPPASQPPSTTVSPPAPPVVTPAAPAQPSAVQVQPVPVRRGALEVFTEWCCSSS